MSNDAGDDEPVSKLPRGRMLKFSGPEMFRILMTLCTLIGVVVLAKPCANSVSNFVVGYPQGSGEGSNAAAPRPGTVEPPPMDDNVEQNYERLRPGMTDEEIKAAIERSKAKSAAQQGSAGAAPPPAPNAAVRGTGASPAPNAAVRGTGASPAPNTATVRGTALPSPNNATGGGSAAAGSANIAPPSNTTPPPKANTAPTTNVAPPTSVAQPTNPTPTAPKSTTTAPKANTGSASSNVAPGTTSPPTRAPDESE